MACAAIWHSICSAMLSTITFFAHWIIQAMNNTFQDVALIRRRCLTNWTSHIFIIRTKLNPIFLYALPVAAVVTARHDAFSVIQEKARTTAANRNSSQIRMKADLVYSTFVRYLAINNTIARITEKCHVVMNILSNCPNFPAESKIGGCQISRCFCQFLYFATYIIAQTITIHVTALTGVII